MNKTTDRTFGLVMAAFCIILSFAAFRYIYPVLALILILVALFKPILLSPLNILWYRLGLVLHHVMNPIILGILYFFVITPFGIILRLFSYDALKLKDNKKQTTYWIERNPPGPKPESLSEQF